ncbi:MAG: thioredoxin domain-containing protein, partial [Solirubrobacterales bacterium]|nr:thioredoxin domain-containing protein [Solirubrobacterales bacterium]
PQAGRGLPSWRTVLEAVAEAWEERREEILQQSPQILASLNATARLDPSSEPIQEAALAQAVTAFETYYDRENGGFGPAPKFPQATAIELLLTRGEESMALRTLEAMARGGIYDQVGGGFARYAVDATWTVPHFEKMLYDNALLARAYLHGWQVSGRELFRRTCRETLGWALREMRGPEGGFWAALDADSEGVEGKFYVWTLEELRQALGELADEAIAYFGASERGNFESGQNVLEARGPEPAARAEIRRRLYEARAHRVRPGIDDKRLTGWNALMISALAEAGAVLDDSTYLEAARRCASFILEQVRAPDGRLLRTWKEGRARIDAFLEDYAYLLDALLTLYESTFEVRWYREAIRVADELIDRFEDRDRGGFFTTAQGQDELPVRRKDLEDSPIPSGNSAAAFGLLRLALLSGDGKYERHALGVLRLLFPLAARHPLAFTHLLRAADFYLAPVPEVAIVGPPREAEALLRVVRNRFRPHLVLAASHGPGNGVPLLEDREPVDGHAAAYVCQHFVCQAPVTTATDLESALG